MVALKRARIPDRYWPATIEQVKGERRWLHQATGDPTWWGDKGWGFYICGPFNTGKTACAAILAMEMLRRCHAVLWLAVREVASVRFHEGALAALDDRLQTADFVVLDDLGGERFKLDGAGGTALEETVRIVMERGRSVVFTSNVPWPEFASAYAPIPAFVSVVQRHTIPVLLQERWPDAPNVGGAM
jgi:DNA replication protein DnaC